MRRIPDSVAVTVVVNDRDVDIPKEVQVSVVAMMDVTRVLRDDSLLLIMETKAMIWRTTSKVAVLDVKVVVALVVVHVVA